MKITKLGSATVIVIQEMQILTDPWLVMVLIMVVGAIIPQSINK